MKNIYKAHSCSCSRSRTQTAAVTTVLNAECAQNDRKSENRGLEIGAGQRFARRSRVFRRFQDVAILGADQKERGLWGREWLSLLNQLNITSFSGSCWAFNEGMPHCCLISVGLRGWGSFLAFLTRPVYSREPQCAYRNDAFRQHMIYLLQLIFCQ